MPRILGAGHKAQPAGYRNALRGYPQFMLLVVWEGELLVDGRAQGPGRWVVLPPGIDTVLSSPRTGYRGCFVEAHPADCRSARRVHLGRSDGALAAVTAQVRTELADPGDDGLLAHLWPALLLQALRRCPGAAEGASPDPVDAAKRRLEAHLYTDDPVERILAGVGVGRRQLARLFLAREGCPPKRWLLRRKVEEARLRLAAPGTTVTQVAFDLGFPSSQHFATTFRRITGATPSAGRR
jgi:AraC-like DNA-binding protein